MKRLAALALLLAGCSGGSNNPNEGIDFQRVARMQGALERALGVGTEVAAILREARAAGVPAVQLGAELGLAGQALVPQLLAMAASRPAQ
jgi:hypothetical protein